MRSRLLPALAALTIAAALELFAASRPAAAAPVGHGPAGIRSGKNDKAAPLRDLVRAVPSAGTSGWSYHPTLRPSLNRTLQTPGCSRSVLPPYTAAHIRPHHFFQAAH